MTSIPLAALLAGVLNATPVVSTAPHASHDSARVEQIGRGIYAIIHPDATEDWPHSNTGVIIGDDGVLVVDATYLPSRAAADIALIRRLTSLPVRYLVNTHWHYDHNNGNATYAAAFPGLTIISQHETRRIMAVNAARYARGVAASGSPSAQELSRLVADTLPPGRASDAARANISARSNELAELATLQAALPTLTFDRSLTLRLGQREVRILTFGRANTPGDAVVYVPDDRVLFTGDMVVAPVPYAFNSSPVEWTEALDAMMRLPAGAIVPGHGTVQHDHAYTLRVRDLIAFVVESVARLASTGLTKDQTRAALDLARWRDAFVGTDGARAAIWDQSIVQALVDRSWEAARGIH